MNSHHDSSCGEIRPTLHLMSFSVAHARSLKPAYLVELQQRVGRQTSQRLARKEVSKAKGRHLICSLRVCQRRLWKSQVFRNTLLSPLHCPLPHCQHRSELLSLGVPPEIQALQRGRDANDDHDSDAMKTSGSLPWPLRCHCLPRILISSMDYNHRPRSAQKSQETPETSTSKVGRYPPAAEA